MQVRVEGLNFKYDNSKELVLKNFEMSISKGEILAILGSSGSGKSTVLRLLTGLESPKSGLIEINGKVVIDDNTYVPPEKRGIGMVFQDYALFPHMTVEQNIKFGLHKKDKKEKEKIVKEMLELVNLNEYGKRYPYELSGGQQQRVALARAIAPKPALILLDEPFSNLDRALQIKIRSELKDILKKAEMTSIIVTHDEDDAKAIADNIMILSA